MHMIESTLHVPVQTPMSCLTLQCPVIMSHTAARVMYSTATQLQRGSAEGGTVMSY